MASRGRIDRLVPRLVNGKAPGPDALLDMLLEDLPQGMQGCLFMWVQGIIAKGQVRNCMKRSLTVLINKKGGQDREN